MHFGCSFTHQWHLGGLKMYCQKKRYKSCHWGGTFSKRYTFVPKGCILVP